MSGTVRRSLDDVAWEIATEAIVTAVNAGYERVRTGEPFFRGDLVELHADVLCWLMNNMRPPEVNDNAE